MWNLIYDFAVYNIFVFLKIFIIQLRVLVIRSFRVVNVIINKYFKYISFHISIQSFVKITGRISNNKRVTS